MAFKYKNKIVNTNNYMEIFNGYPVDVLDEVRLAVLDDTAIGSYIDICKDVYLLGQIRKAIREYLPTKYISTHLSGSFIALVRKLYREGNVGLSQIDRYIENGVPKISVNSLVQLLGLIQEGYEIDKVDFTKINDNSVSLFCKGIKKGYPMWLFLGTSESISNSTIRLLMKAMAVGIDIHPFLVGNWQDDCISSIVSLYGVVDTKSILENVTSEFNMEQLDIILSLAQAKYPIELLCLKDNKGTPVFNSYQMKAIAYAVKNDIDLGVCYDSSCSDRDMWDYCNSVMLDREEKNQRKLSGRLRK